MTDRLYVVVSGNPRDGFAFTGPFASVADAEAWACSSAGPPLDYWIAPLNEPETA